MKCCAWSGLYFRMVYLYLNNFQYVFHKSPMADNFVFALCYRVTVLILVALSFIVTCRLLLGNSITCVGNSTRNDFVHTYCYEDNVYTAPKLLPAAKSEYPLGEFYRYQSYYAWVNLLLLVHAFNFYAPHFLWKCYEGGYIRRLSAGVEKFFDKEEKRGLELCYLAKYVIVTEGKHKLYTCLYIFFEACNYACSLGQTLWLVTFFRVTGVPDTLSYKLNTWKDFRHFYFPPSGQCKYGQFKSDVSFKATCLLPLNKLYMTIFLLLHAWYIFLAILCGTVLIYRIFLIIPSFRVRVMKFTAPLAEKDILKSLCHRLSYSDWFFITRLQKSMSDVDFAQMIDKIAIVSQCKSIEEQAERTSLFDETSKDLRASTATSPL